MIHPFLSDQKFWETLSFLLKMEDKVEISFIAKHLKVDANFLENILVFLKNVNCEFKRTILSGKLFLIPPAVKPKIQMEFNLIEWLKFQAHFPLFNQYANKPFFGEIASKLSFIEEKYKENDLFNGLSLIQTLSNVLPIKKEKPMEKTPDLPAEMKDDFKSEYKDIARHAIENKCCLNILAIGHHGEIEIYPHRMVFLDGSLCLIGEEVINRSLMYLPLNKLESMKAVKEIYDDPAFKNKDVDDFIEAIRVVSGNELRLVLKIINPEKASELNPLFHFLRKPYVISNPKGDLIWAASIEENEDLYEWLSNLTSKVEILDPMSFKKNFLEYCNKKLKNTG